MYATLAGDVTICSAYSHELPKFGMKAGLTNYAATYATGLLCARRLLTKYGLAETYEGNTDDIGQEYHVEAEDDERRPFKCFLDVGLVRTSTGSRVFAALKGAVDGGLDIPHNDKRYAGYDLQDKSLDPDTLERYIKGGVVAEYAEEMADEEPEKYAEHFSKYIAEDFEPVDLEVAPTSFFGVSRIAKQLGPGGSEVGGTITAVQRDLGTSGLGDLLSSTAITERRSASLRQAMRMLSTILIRVSRGARSYSANARCAAATAWSMSPKTPFCPPV